MKLIIDIPEKDWKFMRETYKGTGFSFVLSAIKNECVNAVYNGTPYEERKTGKWEYGNLFRTCSVCRATTGEKDDFNDWFPDKYCPNCGAEMEADK